MTTTRHPLCTWLMAIGVALIWASILAIYFIAQSVSGQPYSAVNLTWLEASNRMQGTPFQVWHGSVASHNYDGFWPAPSNTMTVTVSMLGPGPHYIAITQMSTNSDGTGGLTGFSGEVDFNSFQDAVVQPGVSNMVLECSTNLGQSWQQTGTNLVTVPLAGVSQAFYRGRANFTVTIETTNLIDQITNAP